jgi:hypothetical protein
VITMGKNIVYILQKHMRLAILLCLGKREKFGVAKVNVFIHSFIHLFCLLGKREGVEGTDSLGPCGPIFHDIYCLAFILSVLNLWGLSPTSLNLFPQHHF